MQYPKTRVDVVDDLWHGTVVQDPYRWLEDGSSPEVRAWEDEQDRLARSVLDGRPDRAAWVARLLELASVGLVGWPRVVGGYLYYDRRDPGENQLALYRRRLDGGPEEPILDPNRQHASGLVALDWYHPSPDGRYVAYGYSLAGDEWSTLYVRDIASGTDLPDAIPRTRYCSVAWLPGGERFLYTRYPSPGTVPSGEENYHRTLYFHQLGRPWEQDPVVLEPPDRRDSIHAEVSENGRWLVVTIHHGWTTSDILVRDLEDPEAPFELITPEPGLHTAHLSDGRLYLETRAGGARGRILGLTLEAGEEPEEVVPEHPSWALQAVAPWRGGLLLHYLEDAAARVLYWHPAHRTTAMPLPGLGTVSGLTGGAGPSCYVRYESTIEPPCILAWDGRGETSPLVAMDLSPLPAQLERLWAQSADGTRVPLFLVSASTPPAPRPTILTGYGGFDVAITPTYSNVARAWVEAGGHWAIAVLRGGSEYGEDWHHAGMRDQKQRVFDDFQAAARTLVAEGPTPPGSLGIYGGSNGGLLVGATITQAPALVAAAVAGVPLMDMLRFHKVLIGDLWTSEYGSPDDPDAFPHLYAYSPYHRVQEGTQYPATLIHTARRDSRVDPMHARKMAARLQSATGGDAPILLRVEQDAGHGIGMPMALQVELWADVLTFLGWRLGLSGPGQAK